MLTNDQKKKRIEANKIREKVIETEDENLFIFTHSKKLRGVDFMLVYQDAANAIANDTEMKGMDLRVFLKMIGTAEFENIIPLSQTEIAKELKTYQQTISLSIKRLIDKNFIEVVPYGRGSAYKLTERTAWKGKVKNMERFKEQEEKNAN